MSVDMSGTAREALERAIAFIAKEYRDVARKDFAAWYNRTDKRLPSRNEQLSFQEGYAAALRCAAGTATDERDELAKLVTKLVSERDEALNVLLDQIPLRRAAETVTDEMVEAARSRLSRAGYHAVGPTMMRAALIAAAQARVG